MCDGAHFVVRIVGNGDWETENTVLIVGKKSINNFFLTMMRSNERSVNRGGYIWAG